MAHGAAKSQGKQSTGEGGSGFRNKGGQRKGKFWDDGQDNFGFNVRFKTTSGNTSKGCGFANGFANSTFKGKGAAKGKGGTGLGLAIVRAIAEAHSGSATLATGGPPEVVFRVTLPAA